MRHALVALVVFLLFAGAASAATFDPVSDAALVEGAELIVRGTVVSSTARLRADGLVVTDHRLIVEEVLKGSVAAEVVVSEVGGSVNGRGAVIAGSASYAPGMRVLAFLRARGDGTFFTANMALGRFRFAAAADGSEWLTRDTDGIEVDAAGVAADAPRAIFPARELLEFVRSGAAIPQSDELRVTSDANLQPVSDAAGDYALRGSDGSTTLPVRWACFSSCLKTFRLSGTQAGVPDSEVSAAAALWDVSGSFIKVKLGQRVNTTSPYNDGQNDVVLGSNDNPVPGMCDGAKGCGIVWFDVPHMFPQTNGEAFYTIESADVIIRPGVLASEFRRVTAHEFGHALGIRHSNEPGRTPNTSNALMNAAVSVNSLQSYDIDAVTTLYGTGPVCAGPAITGTSGGGTWPHGSTKQLSVTVSGSGPFTYRWYKGQSGNTAEQVGTSSTFTTPPITAAASYWVRVTSQCGQFPPADSPTITVQPDACTAPAITTQPASQQIQPGGTATLSVTATGTGTLTYRWFEATVVGDDAKAVAVTQQFTTPPLSATRSYWVRVSNSCGEAMSALATITVVNTPECLPPAITAHPASATVAQGTGASLNVTATGTEPLAYQWFAGDSGDESQPIAGATSRTLFLPPFTAAGTFKYWVRVSGSCPNAQPARSNTAVLTVTCGLVPVPTLFAPPASHASSGYDVEWSGNLDGASHFELQEATDAAFTQNLRTFNVTGARHQRIDARPSLTANTRFFYRVRAFSSCTQQATEYSRTASTVVTAPLPATSNEFSLSVPLDATEPIRQSYFVAGFGAQATSGDAFSIGVDVPWISVTPSSGTLPAAGLTVQFTISPATLEVGSTSASVVVTRTQGSGKGGIVTDSTSKVSLPFSISKVTPVTPAPRNATPPPGTLIIPAVAHADGVGTRFQSDVRIANASAQELTYEVSFTPSGASGIDSGKMTRLTIPPRETKGLDDIVKAWYGAGLLGEGGLGTLEIRPTVDVEPFSTFASSRTYAVTAKGTLGQFIPALGLQQFVGNVAADPLAKISLQQIANSAAYRTNVGFVEGSGEPAELIVRLLDGNNNVLKEVERAIPPYGHEQLAFNALFGNVAVDDGRIEMFVKSTGGKVTAYASVVDNKTSDPLLIFPTQAGRATSATYVVPGVAEVDNGPASNFHSDMRIFNASQSPVDVTLDYYPQAGDATPRPRAVTMRIEPLQVKAIDNVLPSVWSLSRTGGAVTVTAPTAVPLVVTARTFSREADNGTYGQFIPGVTAAEATGRGERGLELLQLEQTEQYRTNVGLIEVTGKPVTVEVIAQSPQSKFSAVAHFELTGHEFRQMRLFSAMGFPDNVYNGRITVRVVGGEGRVAAYGSVIDNRTVDPTYVPAQ